MLFPNLYESGYSELYLIYEELFYEHTKPFGRMCVYKNFDALRIYVDEYPRGNLKDAGYYGLMIAAPATTLEEAKEVANIYYFVPHEPIEIK